MATYSRKERKDRYELDEYFRGLPSRKSLSHWIGRRFGLLTVYSFSRYKGNAQIWLCRCDCGACIEVWASNLCNGATTSCGHLMRQQQAEFNARIQPFRVKHMCSGTRIYSIWSTMKSACEQPKCDGYPNVGGKGIRICERWQEFNNFLSDMGDPEEHLYLKRLDNSKDFSPENCYWDKTRNVVRQKPRRVIEWNGKSLGITAWAKELGMSYQVISCRLSAGWAIEKAFTTPVRDHK